MGSRMPFETLYGALMSFGIQGERRAPSSRPDRAAREQSSHSRLACCVSQDGGAGQRFGGLVPSTGADFRPFIGENPIFPASARKRTHPVQTPLPEILHPLPPSALASARRTSRPRSRGSPSSSSASRASSCTSRGGCPRGGAPASPSAFPRWLIDWECCRGWIGTGTPKDGSRLERC